MKTDFLKWYTQKARENDGLISPASAAKMIGISTQHLNRIVEMGRITKHYFEKTPFIGLTEIYEEIQRRQAKEIAKEMHENITPLIYPDPEHSEWLKQLQEKYKSIMGGATEEQRHDFLDKKLQEWKKSADPERVKLLAERTKKLTMDEFKRI